MTREELYEQLRKEGCNKMFLIDLVKENGHKLIHYTQLKEGRKYETVFNYSEKYGGTFDSFKYYNEYYVDITN